jgi:hypothetical protein
MNDSLIMHYCRVGETGRSFADIGLADLLRLAELAADAEAELFARNPARSGRYTGRLIARALCQGAALHYVDGRNGIKDFDVWSFYTQHDDGPFPPRWRGTRDFGPSKFGRFPGDPTRYTGRRVDLLGRSLPVAAGTDPADAIHCYLAAAKTKSARELAAQAVVFIDPANRAGEVVWPKPRQHGLRSKRSTCVAHRPLEPCRLPGCLASGIETQVPSTN